MKSHLLLAETLLAASIAAAPALAQTSTPVPSPAGPADWVAKANGDWRTSKLNGLAVFDRANNKLGSIDDILVDPTGQVRAVVLSVGGVLGIGDHLVAVPFDRLQFLFKTPNGQFVSRDGSPVIVASPDTGRAESRADAAANAAGANASGAASSGGVDSALSDAGRAILNAGQAIGNAAVVTGSAAADRLSAALNDNDPTPDRTVLDATKQQLMAAPQFAYGKR